ncbi:MAG: hypothetical protein RLZZ156_147 [Deinococcota bacterium]|jgi:hypothetical protein
MNKIFAGLTALVLSSALVACPPTPVNDALVLNGTLEQNAAISFTSIVAIKVYPVTNPRVDLFDGSAFFATLLRGVLPLGVGTFNSSTGAFSVTLPSSTVMQSYSSPRQFNIKANCTNTGASTNLGNVAQVLITLHNSSDAIIGYVAQETPGERTAGVAGTFYDVMRYWSSTAFTAQQSCTSADYQGNLQVVAGWNTISFRTITQPLQIFDRVQTISAAPNGVKWLFRPEPTAIGVNAPMLAR